MEKAKRRCVFTLTSLQIGDLQSYLSHRSLFLARRSKKLYILVDNRPWLEDLGLRSAHLWQLMITKSRLSPFANTKSRKERRVKRDLLEPISSPKSLTSKLKNLKKWFALIDLAAISQKRPMLPVKKLKNSLTLNSKLHATLHGLIIFEVEWSDVRGINYLNELQTDTSLAIETKRMKRWEFDSVEQAAACIGSWFPGTIQEAVQLKDYLDSIVGDVFYDAEEIFSRTGTSCADEIICNENMCHEGHSTSCIVSNRFNLYSPNMEDRCNLEKTPPPPDGPYKRRKVMDPDGDGVDLYQSEIHSDCTSPLDSLSSYASDCEDAIEPTQYKDILILFRFNDHDLPFELRDIITSDLRLLTLLEAGLPSWVIFLQSYPVFCRIYRPWMCPFARTLYVMVSLITVLIGFYDLYKNVPVLKATAASLCGPLIDWIETWEMVTRIKYLGTMLFLQNFEKAVIWFLMVSRTMRSFVSVITQPFTGPVKELLNLLFPFWNICVEIFGSLFSVISVVMKSSFDLLEDLIQLVLTPLWFIVSAFWKIAIFIIYPIFQLMWEIVYAPIRLVLGLANFIIFVGACVYELILDLWLFTSGLVQVASTAEATVHTIEVSMWRTLWDELGSQIFRAVRSILNGFVAFFAACNRHRLSIFHHSRELTHKLSRPAERLRPAVSSRRGYSNETQNLTEEGRYELESKTKGNRYYTLDTAFTCHKKGQN